MNANDRVRGVLADYRLSTDRSGLVEALVMAVRLGDFDEHVASNPNYRCGNPQCPEAGHCGGECVRNF